jgi:hypothetical protein
MSRFVMLPLMIPSHRTHYVSVQHSRMNNYGTLPSSHSMLQPSCKALFLHRSRSLFRLHLKRYHDRCRSHSTTSPLPHYQRSTWATLALCSSTAFLRLRSLTGRRRCTSSRCRCRWHPRRRPLWGCRRCSRRYSRCSASSPCLPCSSSVVACLSSQSCSRQDLRLPPRLMP